MGACVYYLCVWHTVEGRPPLGAFDFHPLLSLFLTVWGVFIFRNRLFMMEVCVACWEPLCLCVEKLPSHRNCKGVQCWMRRVPLMVSVIDSESESGEYESMNRISPFLFFSALLEEPGGKATPDNHKTSWDFRVYLVSPMRTNGCMGYAKFGRRPKNCTANSHRKAHIPVKGNLCKYNNNNKYTKFKEGGK